MIKIEMNGFQVKNAIGQLVKEEGFRDIKPGAQVVGGGGNGARATIVDSNGALCTGTLVKLSFWMENAGNGESNE